MYIFYTYPLILYYTYIPTKEKVGTRLTFILGVTDSMRMELSMAGGREAGEKRGEGALAVLHILSLGKKEGCKKFTSAVKQAHAGAKLGAPLNHQV